MSEPVRGVIFDMDGVLVDSYAAHLRSWRRMAAEYGRRITDGQFADAFGRTTREILALLWGHYHEEAELEAMDARKEELYREIVATDVPAMAGARELVRGLSGAGFRLAVGSSGPAENVAVAVTALGLDECFHRRVCGGDVERGKPDPEVFLKAAELLGVPPRRCAVVEDAVHGVEAAVGAGMTCIGLTGSNRRETLQAEGAALVVDSLTEVAPARIAEMIDARARRPSP